LFWAEEHRPAAFLTVSFDHYLPLCMSDVSMPSLPQFANLEAGEDSADVENSFQ